MERLGTLLPGFVRRAAADEEVALIFLEKFWPRMVGLELARKTRPLALTKRTLLIAVPDEGWKGELSSLRGMFLDAVNAYWGANLVERINFRVHPKHVGEAQT
jgi:predicted nucleic acid-binding Zn ribbon protein